VVHVTDSAADTPFDQYYATSASGVTDYGNSDATEMATNALVPAPAFVFPPMPGTISLVVATNLPDGTGVVADADRVVQVAGTESVTVGAGVFANAVKVVVSLTGLSLTPAPARWRRSAGISSSPREAARP
jgi:hypothetical protein